MKARTTEELHSLIAAIHDWYTTITVCSGDTVFLTRSECQKCLLTEDFLAENENAYSYKTLHGEKLSLQQAIKLPCNEAARLPLNKV